MHIASLAKRCLDYFWKGCLSASSGLGLGGLSQSKHAPSLTDKTMCPNVLRGDVLDIRVMSDRLFSSVEVAIGDEDGEPSDWDCPDEAD
ncbi:hypothetical protein [Rubritalea tangerina]|uniref:hypothetical protein n=1 Tax=Rubritalea tangerina TaxID=430798 RepID=UPI003615AA41